MAVLLHLAGGPQDAGQICRRLRFSVAERQAVTALIHEYRRVRDLPSMRPGEVRKMVRRAAAGDLLEVYRVASLARGETTEAFVRAAEVIAALGGTRGRARPLVSGRDLIALGHAPGPGFARILAAVEAAHADGLVATSMEARAWVRTRFPAGAASQPAEPSPEPNSRSTSGADGG
jgi:poly(A) polymerase